MTALIVTRPCCDATGRASAVRLSPISPDSTADVGLARAFLGDCCTGASYPQQSTAGSFPAGTPGPVEVVMLAVHDSGMLEYRDRAAADSAYKAMSTAALTYVSARR